MPDEEIEPISPSKKRPTFLERLNNTKEALDLWAPGNFGDSIKEAGKEGVKKVTKKVAKQAAKAAARAVIQLASAFISLVTSLSISWPVVIGIIALVIILFLALFFVAKANVKSPGSEFIYPQENATSISDKQYLATVSKSFRYKESNVIARLVMKESDWQLIEQNKVDARVIHLIRLLTDRFDHVKVDIQAGYKDEGSFLTRESDPGMRQTVSAHFSGQAVDVLELGTSKVNGWKWIKVNRLADQANNNDAAGKSAQKTITGLIEKTNSRISRTSQNKVLEEKNKAVYAAWNETLSPSLFQLNKTYEQLQKMTNVLRESSGQADQMKAEKENELILNTAKASIEFDKLSEYANKGFEVPEGEFYNPENVVYVEDGIAKFYESLAAFMSMINSYIQDYRLLAQARGEIFEALSEFSQGFSSYVRAANSFNTGSDYEESLNQVTDSLRTLNHSLESADSIIQEIPNEYHGGVWEIVSKTDELTELDQLKEIIEEIKAVENQKNNSLFSSESLNQLKEASYKFADSLDSISSLKNFSLFADLPYNGHIITRDFRPLTNLEHLSNLKELSRLDGFNLDWLLENSDKSVAAEIRDNFQFGFESLSDLANLSYLSRVLSTVNNSGCIDELNTCQGLESLNSLTKLKDIGSIYPLTNISQVGNNLAELANLSVMSDPLSVVEPDINVSDLSKDNLAPLENLKNIKSSSDPTIFNMIPDNNDPDLAAKQAKSRSLKAASDAAREDPAVREIDDQLTKIAPGTIYRYNAQRAVKEAIELANSQKEPWRPRQTLAVTKLDSYDPFNPNFGQVLSKFLIDRIHFGF